MSNDENKAGLASDLNRELDVVNNNIMCFWRDDIEISHYLMAHINDKGNMEAWQESLCVDAAVLIDKLRDEVKRLRNKVYELENDCKICGCGDIYQNSSLGAAMIEKSGSCENCITDI